MKPTDLKCYKHVASVIGEDYADYELQRVIDYKDCQHLNSSNFRLTAAFSWVRSPQGWDFWNLVTGGKIPYEHGHEKSALSEITPANSDKTSEPMAMIEPSEELREAFEKSGTQVGGKERSDGSTASYYELPESATQLQHLISHRNMNSQIGEIFRACYRYGLVSHSDMLRDAKKIKFYAQAEIERLEKLAQSDK